MSKQIERRTREQIKAKSRKHYLKYRDELLIKARAKRLKHREAKIEYLRRWRRDFPDKAKESHRKYYVANRDAVLAYGKQRYELKRDSILVKAKERYQRLKPVVCARARDYRKRTPSLRLARAVRKATWKALKSQNVAKRSRYFEMLGCDLEFLRRFIESQFKSGMCWENMGKWHIDHVMPVARFNLTKPEHLRTCFHYSNLRPLWEKDNLRKGAKLPPAHQPCLL